MQPAAAFSFRWPEKNMGRLATVLAKGVAVRTETGISLSELLCGRLGFNRAYVDNSIQTIFVNGRAVDRIDQVYIDSGAVVALSAAMPGLAGATLRRGGHLAGMRREISHQGNISPPVREETLVTLKLFNLVYRDLAPRLLLHGIWINGRILESLIRGLTAEETAAMDLIRWNETAITYEALLRLPWPDDWVALKIDFHSNTSFSSNGNRM